MGRFPAALQPDEHGRGSVRAHLGHRGRELPQQSRPPSRGRSYRDPRGHRHGRESQAATTTTPSTPSPAARTGNGFSTRATPGRCSPINPLRHSDWTDARVGGHGTSDEAASGVIYRIAPKGFKPIVPRIDLTTTEGAIAAMESPANNVRWSGFNKLNRDGAKATKRSPRFWKTRIAIPSSPPARSGCFPYLGKKGAAKLDEILVGDDAKKRLTAFRSIRRCGGRIDALPYAKKLAPDESAAVRA